MKWVSEILRLNMFDISFYVSVIIGIILIILAIIFLRYYFKDSDIKHITPFVIFIVFLMLASYAINFVCEQRPFKALFNMIGMFFTIDYEIVDFKYIFIEPIYYLIKLLAICATFYMVIFRFFYILKKEEEIKKVKMSIDDYVILFSDGSLKEYIKKHSTKMIDAVELDEDCYNGKSYFIAYDSDQKNISFYSNNKERLKDKNVAVLINDVESSLFNEEGYHVVNLNEIIAQDFWLNNADLFNIVKPEEETIICLIGLDAVGRNIFKSGLLNNIYSTRQKIIYKVWGDKEVFDTLDIDLKGTSNDEIYYMGTDLESISDDSIEEINKSDMCVISKWDNLIIQEVVSRAYKCKNLWIYDKEESLNKTSSMFVNEALKYNNNEEARNRSIEFFGKIDINDEMLFANKTIELAKNINWFYNKKTNNKEELWKSADVYSRKSSIACAQYDAIRKKYLVKKDENQKYYDITEDMKILEHTRWCRFMLLDDWKYGDVLGGTKDKENKLHIDLVPYDELIGNEKNKDQDILNYLNNEVNIEKEGEEKCWKIYLTRKI